MNIDYQEINATRRTAQLIRHADDKTNLPVLTFMWAVLVAALVFAGVKSIFT